MSAYFEKARELAELILKSEESIRLADARAAYLATPDAIGKMQEYTAYQAEVQTSMKNGSMDEDAFKTATKKMTEMAVELKKDEVIGELVASENEFNYFVNQIMDVLKVTITGESKGENCSPDNCGGCSGCGN